MDIRIIRIKDLEDFLQSEEYRQMPVLPISRHRGISHARNPRAKPEEAALVLVYIEGQLMGYLGFVPDTIHFSDSRANLGWMSCIWVSPDARGKGIAKAMLKRGFEEWDDHVIVTEFTEIARNIYQRYGNFMDLAISQGVRAYLRANLAYLLPNKSAGFARIRPLLRLVDTVLNLPNALRLWLYQLRNPVGTLSYTYLSEVDQETESFIRKCQNGELFQRGATELNWMLKHPWVLSAPRKDEPASRYYFTSVSKRFDFLPIQVFRSDGTIAAFLILAIRNRNLKIPYAYFSDSDLDLVLPVIYQHMLEMNLDMLTVYHPVLVQAIREKKKPFYLVRSFQRHYLISTLFKEGLTDHPRNMQDGDGDCAFT